MPEDPAPGPTPATSPAEAPPNPRSRGGHPTLLPLPPVAVLLGAFLVTYGLLTPDAVATVVGLVAMAVGLLLFAYEGAWSKGVVLPEGSPPPPGTPPAWWHRPVSFHGRFLCPSCGWRQDDRATICPRCGKRLVRLWGEPIAKS